MPVSVQVLYQAVAESKDQTDASVQNVIEFDAPIRGIAIHHDEAGAEDFIVNGLTIKVPPGGWRSAISGVASENVTIPNDVDCVLHRLV